MSRRIIHVTAAIEWFLDEEAWPDEKISRALTRGDQFLSAEEAREHFREELAKGHTTILLAPEGSCEGFSPVTGCPGHVVEEGR